MPDQAANAKTFLALHHAPRMLVLPNAWDALSARLFEEAGFPAVATTSAGIAATFGYPDGQHIPPRLMLDTVACIARTLAVPLTADLEAGYGDTIDDILATFRNALSLGIAGANLEDSTRTATHRTFAEIPQHAALLRALKQQAHDAKTPFVLNARVDTFLDTTIPPEARTRHALARATAYVDAGADVIFPIGLKEPETIATLVKEIPAPLNIMHTPLSPSITQLEQLGVKRVSFGASLQHALLPALQTLARDLFTTGTSPTLAQTQFNHLTVNQRFNR